MTTRNAFADPIEAPDGNTKILAKDGINDAGYVTVEDISGVVLDGISLPDPTQTWVALGGGSELDISGGFFWTDAGATNIWRFADRVFIGAAASQFAGNSAVGDAGSLWLDDPTLYPAYLAVNAHVLVATDGPGPYGYVAGMRSSDAGDSVIGFGAAMIGDSANNAWGGIIESQRENDGSQCLGWELAMKNKANDMTITPNAQVFGSFGVWAVAGGDPVFGGVATNPSTAAMVILGNGATTWNDGIVFFKNSLTSGRAIALSSEGVGGAHYLGWYNAAGGIVSVIKSSNTSADTWELDNNSGGWSFRKGGGAVLEIGTSGTTSSNGFLMFCGAPGIYPQLLAAGPDTDIDIAIGPKGAGLIRYGTHTGTADTAVSGYITIKDSGGTLRKLAVIT